MPIKPFSPADVKRLASDTLAFPEEVIQVVNGILTEEGRSGNYIVVYQDKVLDRLDQLFAEKGKMFDREEAFDRHWLDFEEVYRSQGWKVTYDKPGYCESYEPRWVFEPATK